ncbi:hypothetical protein [Salinirarus marinus]|uniref:hypothetical protein n=1 Tax=Salinirarus marinus TaxID=3068310 RepID=UPI003C6CAD07
MADRANPAFATGAIAIPLAAFALAATVGTREIHTYVHVMAGVLWTGIDVFMALVVGPVLGSLSGEMRARWFERFTPKMTFLMPSLATVTIFGGITLAVRLGGFPNSGPWIGLFAFVAFVTATVVLGRVFDAFTDRRWQAFFALVLVGNGGYLASELLAAGTLPGTRPVIVVILAVMVVLTVQGFGFLLPNEVLIYQEMMSESPDTERIGRLGMRNAKLSGVQGVFQLVIVVLMVYLRWGGF